MTTNSWYQKIGEAIDGYWSLLTLNDGWMTNDKLKETMQYQYFNDNTEWNFYGFKIDLIDLRGDDKSTGKYVNTSTVNVKLAFKRHHPFYSLSLIVPIMMLVVLSPLGLLLPADTGEKLGFMMTLLLTVVIYIDYIQTNIPVFGTLRRTPHLLNFFLSVTGLLCFGLVGMFLRRFPFSQISIKSLHKPRFFIT